MFSIILYKFPFISNSFSSFLVFLPLPLEVRMTSQMLLGKAWPGRCSAVTRQVERGVVVEGSM